MGRVFKISPNGLGFYYSCMYCRTHLALDDDILSTSFYCRHGAAYLFDKCVNITLGEKDNRMMMTGVHTVVDIFCVDCGALLGWKYETAFDQSQKYKEGSKSWVLVSGHNNTMQLAVKAEAHVVGTDPALSLVLHPATIDSDPGTE